MNDCCTTLDSPPPPCPRCGRTGPVVGPAPVRAHCPGATPGPWQHCDTVGCPVVFHLDGATVTDDQAIARVGAKAPAAREPVCFCFAHTRDDLQADLSANGGTSAIKETITAAVADGLCACEHLNPDRSCCLPSVHRTIRSIHTAPQPRHPHRRAAPRTAS